MNVQQQLNRIEAKSSAFGNVDQMSDVLPIEMTNKTGMHLLDLNDYCLLEIFSCGSLTVMDLVALADTCVRFKQIILRLFPKEFSISSSNFFSYTFECKNSSKSVNEQDAELILKHFGSNLCQLSLREKKAAVKKISKYCGGVTLRRLDIYGMKSIQDVCIQLKSIFQERLLGLSLRYCNLKDFTSPHINCNSLIELEIGNSRGCEAILRNNFPSLERFKFLYHATWNINDDNTTAVSQFIGRHKRIKILSLCGGSVYCSTELVDAIGNSCAELEELTLRNLRRPQTSFNVFNRLGVSRLRHVDVDIYSQNYNQIMALLLSSMSLQTVKLFNDELLPVPVTDILSRLCNVRAF